MRLLLDTHVLLWWLANDARLGKRAGEAIAEPENDVYFSAVNAWEIAIKSALGKLQVDRRELLDACAAGGIRELEIRSEHAFEADALPRIHDDPFDRMLAAQAITEGMTLVTADRTVQAYPVPTLPA